MAIYIALLRGINVGGKNIIKMAELKRSFESIGLSRVQTYIQSGNVLFESEEEEETLRLQIERGLEKDFGLTISVILRTDKELEAILNCCPFSKKEISEAAASATGESLYVGLLQTVPPQERMERLNGYRNENEDFRMNDRDIYLLFRNSIRNSKLAVQIEKLGVPVTVRNWKTMNKLAALASAMISRND